MAAMSSASSFAALADGLGAGDAERIARVGSFATELSLGVEGFAALRGSGGSERASVCWMLFKLVATFGAGVEA